VFRSCRSRQTRTAAPTSPRILEASSAPRAIYETCRLIGQKEMSKLGDLLVEIDSRRPRRRGLGEIAGLSERGTRPSRWRLTGLLVMVISMLAMPLAIPLRPRDAAPRPVWEPLAVARGKSSEGTYKISNDDRVHSLVERGAQAAELGDLIAAERL